MSALFELVMRALAGRDGTTRETRGQAEFDSSAPGGYPDRVATRIRELRQERARQYPSAFTIAAVAHRIGVAESAVRRWETGVSRPRKRHARALARDLGVTLSELGLEADAANGEAPNRD